MASQPIPRPMKETVHSRQHSTVLPRLGASRKENLKTLHTQAENSAIQLLGNNSVLKDRPPPIADEEQKLNRKQRCILSQLRSGHCDLLQDYKHRVFGEPSTICTSCGVSPQDVRHLFACNAYPTDLIMANNNSTTYIKTNMRHIHTSIVSMHLATRGNNKILRTPLSHINSSEEILPRLTRRTLSQPKTNKSPFLKSYLHKVDSKWHTAPLCPLCNTHIHNTHYLFNYSQIRTTLSSPDLWTDLAGVTTRLARWLEKLAGSTLKPPYHSTNTGERQLEDGSSIMLHLFWAQTYATPTT